MSEVFIVTNGEHNKVLGAFSSEQAAKDSLLVTHSGIGPVVYKAGNSRDEQWWSCGLHHGSLTRFEVLNRSEHL